MRIVLVIGLSTSALAGCASAGARGGPLTVVAAENVYGNIAAQIGGRHVAVTSLLTAPDADPHLFQPATRAGLAVAQARLVIANGAGYDAFVGRLVSATATRARVLTVADALGVHGRDANPHLWYDVPELGRIARAIATALGSADPAHAAAYQRGLSRFDASLEPLRREVARIRERFRGVPVAYTEPVPGYLLAAAGLRNIAPAAFTRAIENGSEPPPDAVAAMGDLIAKRRIRVLLYNSQAASPTTARLRDAAERRGVAVVAVRETLPPGRDFQDWQLAQARALAAALAR